MMTSEEIRQMNLKARMMLSIADAEEWSETDSSRILANLAIKAGSELGGEAAENAELKSAIALANKALDALGESNEQFSAENARLREALKLALPVLESEFWICDGMAEEWVNKVEAAYHAIKEIL